MPVPPTGIFPPPSDDWTDDPSFDLASSSSSFPTSPSSSSGSRSSRPSFGRQLSGSPLRQMHNKSSMPSLKPAKATIGGGDDDDDFDFDLPDEVDPFSKPPLRAGGISQASTPKAPRAASSASASSMRSLPATVMGQGPAGVGTITRLGGKAPTGQLAGTVKARARAIEMAWEADVDFDVPVDLKTRRMTFSPPRKSIMPDASALDDLGFDLEDEDQATLRAGSTIKAMLPPKRRPAAEAASPDAGGTIRLAPKHKAKPHAPPPEDDDLEGDLVLPLNLTNLALAAQAHQPKAAARAPRSSLASTATDWDNLSTPSTTGRKGGFSWGEDSPSRPGHSETSMTSVSDDLGDAKGKGPAGDEDEDFELGLEIPDPTFFTARKTNVLNSILDRKRKQQYAPPPPAQRRPELSRGDDSFEDGLVFDNPRAELSQRRLEKNRRVRTIPVPFNLGPDRKAKTERERDRERERERLSLGRAQTPSRGGAASSQGLRHHSGGSQGHARERDASAPREHASSSSRRPETPGREPRAASRTRLTSGGSMPPPPVPALPPTTPGNRLRHQKSYHHLAPSPSPTLVRKQSLASMQDAIAAGHVRPDTDLPPIDMAVLRQLHAQSRLTMPTSSSLAKIRAPVTTTSGQRRRQVDIPRRRQWGDGTELDGFEDLRIEDGISASASYGKLGRKSMERLPTNVKPEPEKRKQSTGKRSRQRKPALLIKNLGAVNVRKVVGEMTWNPQTLRWEGNESVLRDFDAVASSTRPALIAHFTGSSAVSAGPAGLSPSAPAPTPRVVGDMKFDPEAMRWVSLVEESDPFEGMADDEDESDLVGTITRASGRKLVGVGFGSAHSTPSHRFVSESSIATAGTTLTGGTSTSTGTTSTAFGGGLRSASGGVSDLPPGLWDECRDAEERHKREMKGWLQRPAASASDERDRERDRAKREMKRLWEVRYLATRI